MNKYVTILSAIFILLFNSSCKKENSSNISIVINGQETKLILKEASLIVNSNANTIAVISESANGNVKLSSYIQNNNSTTTDCIDAKNYDVISTGWTGSTYIDNCSMSLKYNSINYLAQNHTSGYCSITQCDGQKVVSGSFSAWLYKLDNSDSVFVSTGVFENIQLIKI